MELKNLIASGEVVDIYRDGDKVIKLFKAGSPKTIVLYEALTHSRVEEAGMKIPVIHEVSVVDGRWAIVMDHVEGKTFAELIREDPKSAGTYIEQMVDLQMEIHTKTMPKLTKLKDKLQRQINALDCIDDVKRYELLTRLDSMPKHKKLCHNNFTPENVILSKDGPVVIDWVAAKQGNASADVAKTFLMLSLHYPEYAETYMNLFCQKSGTSKRYVQEWLPIVAAARLTENVEAERELLHRWIDVVAYE